MTENSQNNELNWRDEAMNYALRGFDYGENLDAFLYAVRRAQPAFETHILWPDREQVLNFLSAQGPLQSLLSAPNRSTYNDEKLPYIGWYGTQWQGAEVEVAMMPGCSSAVICIGSDGAAVHEFAAALVNFSLRPAGRCLRYSEGWENAPDMDKEIGKVTWDDIVLPPAMHQQLRESIESFFSSRDALREFGFAWKRGVLLVGPPGTGKTMVCKAAAAALPELPFLYVRDLRENRKKDSIKSIFARARQLTPCLLAFEDIDGFVTNENRTIFLNEMDGFANNDGLLIIASSNHPGKIDEALLKRPSRFDRVFHLGVPATAERAAFARHLLNREPLTSRLAPELNLEELCAQVAAKSEGFTPAYLKEAFVAAALQSAHQGAAVLDDGFAAIVIAQVEQLRAHLKRLKSPDALAEMHSIDDVIGFRR